MVIFVPASGFSVLRIIPTVGMMEAQWGSRGTVHSTLDAMDADTDLICTHCVALLPFVAVHRCLAPMSMQQLWALLGQPLVDSSRTVEMGVLLDWIRVASVEPTTQVPPLIQMAAAPVAPLADRSLLSSLSQVVQQWLPGLLAAPMPPPAGGTSTTSAWHPPAYGQ